MRNWDGQFIQALAFNLGASSVLVAEATAMRNGIKVAVQSGFTNIQIENDNSILIQPVQGHIETPWKIHVLLQDIHCYSQSCNCVIVQHTFREGNRAANWLAKLGLTLKSTVVWHQISNTAFHCILIEDNLGLTLERRTT